MNVIVEIDGNTTMHNIDCVLITFTNGDKHIADKHVRSVRLIKSKKESESAKLASGDAMWEDGER